MLSMEDNANATAEQAHKPNNLRSCLLLGALALSVFFGFMAKYYSS